VEAVEIHVDAAHCPMCDVGFHAELSRLVPAQRHSTHDVCRRYQTLLRSWAEYATICAPPTPLPLHANAREKHFPLLRRRLSTSSWRKRPRPMTCMGHRQPSPRQAVGENRNNTASDLLLPLRTRKIRLDPCDRGVTTPPSARQNVAAGEKSKDRYRQGRILGCSTANRQQVGKPAGIEKGHHYIHTRFTELHSN